jgi:hypothetical protein
METLVVSRCDEANNEKKAQRQTVKRSDHANGRRSSSPPTLVRSKALILAALKVWELKQRTPK